MAISSAEESVATDSGVGSTNVMGSSTTMENDRLWLVLNKEEKKKPSCSHIGLITPQVFIYAPPTSIPKKKKKKNGFGRFESAQHFAHCNLFYFCTSITP